MNSHKYGDDHFYWKEEHMVIKSYKTYSSLIYSEVSIYVLFPLFKYTYSVINNTLIDNSNISILICDTFLCIDIWFIVNKYINI